MKTKFFGEKLDCPACGDVAMSAMRKFNLGAGGLSIASPVVSR